MRNLKHWTPRYIFDRSRNIISNRVHADWPWLTPAAVRFLELWLKPSDRVFEWGAGRSTVWIARRAGSIASVEADKNWIDRVRSVVQRKNLRNVNLVFAPEPTDPAAYASFIRQAGGPVDLIVVDALHRDHCALASIEHVNPGGIVLVDNVNWYLPSKSFSPNSRRQAEGPATVLCSEFLDNLKTWRNIWTSNDVTDTAIWIKPY